MTTFLYAIDGSGRCLVETTDDDADALTIRTMPDALFGPKPKRAARQRTRKNGGKTSS
jgi:hypothetical protein